MEEVGFIKRHRRGVRWTVRLFILGLAVFLLLGGPLPDYAARVIPAMSPLSVLSAALAHRTWYISLAWSLPALLVLGLGLWKGRFFCRWICPLGTLYSIPSQFSLKRRFFPWRLNGFFFWFILFASVAGLPLLLFLDPLSTFTRLGAMGQGVAHWMAWIPGVLIPLMLLLSFIQPGIWCAQLCPLGWMVEKVKVKRSIPAQVSQSRREILAGLAFGVPLALLFRNMARASEDERPILPPGAKDLDNFSATCIRCYACVNACPTGVLTVRKKGGVAELCIPEMDFDRHDGAYCEQYCNICSQVCPTGAIKTLAEEEKQQRKIATASILREACLAWEDRQECLACDEFCGYNAFEMRTGNDGLPKPVVNPRKCRGCGACRNICPATRAGNAVKIEPLSIQETITEEDDNSVLGRGGCGRRWGGC
ncbi:MAG: 4Fe-4S dicluster domain-containing protein [Verrucomicrobiota bacterium]